MRIDCKMSTKKKIYERVKVKKMKEEKIRRMIANQNDGIGTMAAYKSRLRTIRFLSRS